MSHLPPPQHSYQRGMMRVAHPMLPSPPAAKAAWEPPLQPELPPQPPAAEAAPADVPAHAHAEGEDESLLSPTALLHRSLLAQKRAAEAEAAADVAALLANTNESATSTPVLAPARPFLLTSDAFPPLPTGALAKAFSPVVHQCVVHGAPLHAHSHGHACTRSTAASAPSSSSPSAFPSRCCLVQHHRASFWNTRCSCIFSALPDELLLFSVFALLGARDLATLGAVCSRWRFLAADRMLWRQVDLSSHPRTIDPPVLDSILSRIGRHVNTLKLCNLRLLDGPALRRLGEEHLAHNNASLRELHFCSLKAVDLSVMTSLFSAAGAGAGLRELSLFGCINVDDECVKLIRASCIRLEELSLRGCLKITDAAFLEEEDASPVTPAAAAAAGVAVPHVDEWGQPSWGGEVSPDAVRMEVDELSLSLAQLDQLDVSRSSSVSSNASYSSGLSAHSSHSAQVAREVGRFAYLTSLNLANCKLLTESGLIAAFRASPRLVKLNLHALNPSDALLDALSRSCPALEQLHLSSANPFMGNARLTDVGVEFLTARLPRMAQLNLQGSSNVTDACIAHIVERWGASIEKLNLGGCFRLTDKAVRTLCMVDEVPSSPVSPSAASASASGSRSSAYASPCSSPSPSLPSKLTHLSLFQCQHLTDASVAILAARLPALKHLDMHSCSALTDAALEALMAREEAEPVPTLASIPPQPQPQWEHKSSASLDEEVALESPPSPSTPAPFLLPHLQSLDIGSCRKLTLERVALLKRTRADVLVTHY